MPLYLFGVHSIRLHNSCRLYVNYAIGAIDRRASIGAIDRRASIGAIDQSSATGYSSKRKAELLGQRGVMRGMGASRPCDEQNRTGTFTATLILLCIVQWHINQQ